MPMVISIITWLCRSCGSKAMALPRRLGQGDGADVHRVRHPKAHGHVERGHRAVGLDAAVLRHPQPRALRDEPQQPATDHDQRGRAGGEQPGVLDARKQTPEVGQRELEARAAAGRLLLLSGKKIYFDHAARLSARPTDSIKRGATSSTATDSNTESRTLSRCTGLARSTGTRSRFDNASFRPGTRAPPPMVYTRPRPPAERDAVART